MATEMGVKKKQPEHIPFIIAGLMLHIHRKLLRNCKRFISAVGFKHCIQWKTKTHVEWNTHGETWGEYTAVCSPAPIIFYGSQRGWKSVSDASVFKFMDHHLLLAVYHYFYMFIVEIY